LEDKSDDENYKLFQKLSSSINEDKPIKLVSDQVETMPPDPPKRPVGIKKKTLTSPDGQVTYITEMLYDVEDVNPTDTRVTRPPSSLPPTPYIPSSTDVLLPPTDDPVKATNAYKYPISSPPDSHSRFKTTETPSDWPSLPTPPTHFHHQHSPSSTTIASLRDRSGKDKGGALHVPAGSDRRESFNDQRDASSHTTASFNTQAIGPPNNHRHSTRPMTGVRSTSKMFGETRHEKVQEKTWKDSLGAAAIAGIVIGSLVSVSLLAGKTW